MEGTAANNVEAAAAGRPASDVAPLLAAAGLGPSSAAAVDARIHQPSDDAGRTSDAPSGKQWTAWEVAWQLRGYAAAVALDFLVTLAVFPGVASSICPAQNRASATPCTPHPHAGRFYGESCPVLFDCERWRMSDQCCSQQIVKLPVLQWLPRARPECLRMRSPY